MEQDQVLTEEVEGTGRTQLKSTVKVPGYDEAKRHSEQAVIKAEKFRAAIENDTSAVKMLPEIKQFENFNLKDILTPVNVEAYERLLRNTGFDVDETSYLVDGFKNGFSLEYDGPRRIARKAKNLLLRVGNKIELWNKVMTEVQAKRYAGSFEEVPFKYFI